VTNKLTSIICQLPIMLPTPMKLSINAHCSNRILVRHCGGTMTSSKSSKLHLFVVVEEPNFSIEASPEHSNLALMTVQL
jgi:hypothetical protein